MAKRTATKTHPDRDGTVLNVETTLLIAKKATIESLAEKKTTTQARVRKINEGFNKDFTKAQESEHVDKRAANIAFGLAGLEDEEFHRTLYHLFFYIKDMGLLDRAKKQEELFSAGETGPAPKMNGNGKDKGHDDGDGAGDTTQPIGAAARRVIEQAGGQVRQD